MNNEKQKLVEDFAGEDEELLLIIEGLDKVIRTDTFNPYVVNEIKRYLEPTEHDPFIDGL